MPGGRHRDADRGEDLARLERGEIGALIELARRDARARRPCRRLIGRAEAQHHRRHVVAGIAVGDVAAERADVAHLRVGDQQRRLAQDRDVCASRSEPISSCWVVMAPMTISPPSARMPFRSGDAGEVDQMAGRREAQLHHRDQAVAAGKRPRFVAEIGEQGDRILDRGRAMVGEGSRDHGQSSRCRAERAAGFAAESRRQVAILEAFQCGEGCAAATIASARRQPLSARSAVDLHEMRQRCCQNSRRLVRDFAWF